MSGDDKFSIEDLIKNGEIILTGPVLDDDWGGWLGGPYISAALVRGALAQFSGDVKIRLNSGGGDAYEGEAIRAAISGNEGHVTIVVEGIAASAASLLLMGADTIEMSAGSMIMIHDPSSVARGNEDDMLKEAGLLSNLANVYATVYAARGGDTVANIRDLMKSETWLGPDCAVAAGLADAVLPAKSKTAMSAKKAKARHSEAVMALKACFEHFKKPSSAMSVAMTAVNDSVTPAESADTMEGNMAPKDLNRQTLIGDPAPTPKPQAQVTQEPAAPVDTAAIASNAAQAERNRIMDIRAQAAPFLAAGSLTHEIVDGLIDNGVTAEAASAKMMTAMADTAPLSPARVAGGQDEVDTRREAMIGAMMHTVSPSTAPLEGAATEYRGLRPKQLAMHLAGGRGGFSDHETIRAGMRSTTMMGGAYGVSDFSYITAEVMNRTLRDQYAARSHNWQLISRRRTASDFREMTTVRAGGDFELQKIEENGEYKQATIKDEGEGLKVANYGRVLTLTFEAIVNDDLGFFERIPMEFARSAAVLEARVVWGILRDNAKLKSDGTALFHTTHKNLAASGSVISVASMQLARSAMARQKALGSVAKDEFLNIMGNLLLGPDALEVALNQFVANTTPRTDADVNPYKNMDIVATPHLGTIAGGSDTAWYLIDKDTPPIEHAYLAGYEGPTILRSESRNPDNVDVIARHIFGAAPAEYRGVYKNPGA